MFMTEKKGNLKEKLIRIIKETIEEQFADEDIELVGLDLKGNEGMKILRVFINKKEGITLDDCAHFSKTLSVVLDMKEPIKSKYTLEVSSPGGRKRKIF